MEFSDEANCGWLNLGSKGYSINQIYKHRRGKTFQNHRVSETSNMSTEKDKSKVHKLSLKGSILAFPFVSAQF